MLELLLNSNMTFEVGFYFDFCNFKFNKMTFLLTVDFQGGGDIMNLFLTICVLFTIFSFVRFILTRRVMAKNTEKLGQFLANVLQKIVDFFKQIDYTLCIMKKNGELAEYG